MTDVLYVMRDRVSGLYSSPFVGSDKHEVIARSVRSAVNSGCREPWAVYPRDHELYKVGTYDTETGVINADTPYFVFNLSDVLED